MEQNKQGKSLAQCAAEQNYKEFETLFKERVANYISSDPEMIKCRNVHNRLSQLIKALSEKEA